MDIQFKHRNEVPTPSTGQVILFYDIDNENILTAKTDCCNFTVLSEFPSLNSQVLDDSLIDIVKGITQKASCAMEKSVITAPEFESIIDNINMFSTVTVDPSTGSYSHGITSKATLFIQFSKTNVLVNGGSSGTATAVISGGTAPYTLTWQTLSGTTVNPAALPAGAYKLTVTDAVSYTKIYTFVIEEPAALALIVNVQNETSGPANDGIASSVVSGGVAPYGYVWNNNMGTPIGQTTQTATGLNAGTYQVVVTDFNGGVISNTNVVIG